MNIQIKICGIKTLEEALGAIEAGAELLGFNFYPHSPRFISPQECSRLRMALESRGISVRTVGVFVNAEPETVARTLDECGLDMAQLSGDEPPEQLRFLKSRSFKGIRPAGITEAEGQGQRYAQVGKSPALLVDAYHPGLYGGTGRTGDWSLAQALAARYPILLAGGLHPGNIAHALAQVRPWGVDVASGVESSPGQKDPRKMTAFVQAVRRWEEEIIQC